MSHSLFAGRRFRQTLLVASGVALAACGGGGGGNGGTNFIPPPDPPPPPQLGQSVRIFPSVTTNTNFATLGYELPGTPGAPLTGDGYSVRYDAASDAYIFDLPTHAPGQFRSTSSNGAYWVGGLPAGTILWPPMNVLKPSATNTEIQLSHTSFASYLRAGPMEDVPHGVVAFGLAAPASAIPISGSATMQALVAGYSANGSDSISGSATLNFDFGAGTLSGQFDPLLHQYYTGQSFSLGRYTFVDTVYGVGSQTFSGNFAHADPALGGSFNGLFTGPNADEMMARWQATYSIQGVTAQPGQMFGVWVGKKCC